MQPSKQKTQEWRDRVAAAKSWPGSLESYCRSAGISAPALAYWRNKLAGEKNSHFVPVEVISDSERSSRSLPDPRWLAELIGHLCGGAR